MSRIKKVFLLNESERLSQAQSGRFKATSKWIDFFKDQRAVNSLGKREEVGLEVFEGEEGGDEVEIPEEEEAYHKEDGQKVQLGRGGKFRGGRRDDKLNF